MSRSGKMFKVAVVAVIALLMGLLIIDNVAFDPKQGFVTTGDLELSWDRPTENTDDSPITDLAGYTVHCWNSEDRQTETIVVQDSEVTRYEIEHLWPGTYQCAVSAVKSDGSQSVLSNVVTKTVE